MPATSARPATENGTTPTSNANPAKPTKPGTPPQKNVNARDKTTMTALANAPPVLNLQAGTPPIRSASDVLRDSPLTPKLYNATVLQINHILMPITYV